MSVIDEDEKLVDHRRKDVTTEIYKKRFNIKENYGNVNKFMVVSNKLWKNRVKEKGSNEPWKLQIFYSGSKSGNSSFVATVLSVVVPERLATAIYPAYCLHCRAFLHDLKHDNYCVYVDEGSYSK